MEQFTQSNNNTSGHRPKALLVSLTILSLITVLVLAYFIFKSQRVIAENEQVLVDINQELSNLKEENARLKEDTDNLVEGLISLTEQAQKQEGQGTSGSVMQQAPSRDAFAPTNPTSLDLLILNPKAGDRFCLEDDAMISWDGPDDLKAVSIGVIYGEALHNLGTFAGSRNELGLKNGDGTYVWEVGCNALGQCFMPASEIYEVRITGRFEDSGKSPIHVYSDVFSVADCRG